MAAVLTIGTKRPARNVPNAVEQNPTSHGSTALPTLAIAYAGPTARGRTGDSVRERSTKVIGNTGARPNPARTAATNAIGTEGAIASALLAASTANKATTSTRGSSDTRSMSGVSRRPSASAAQNAMGANVHTRPESAPP